MKKEAYSATIRRARLRTCLLTLSMLISSAASHAQTPAGPSAIADCTECHGTEGLGFKPGIPHLNGQPEHLLTSMINAFQQGKRPTKVKMHRDIPPGDVAPLARHYALQKAERPKSATQAELVARGATLYQNRCADCHLDNGRDSDKEAPLTAAQDLNYLVAQTLAFKTGERKFPYLMDGAYRDLSDEDLKSIAHFFAAQDQVAPQQGRRRKR
jgi:cytochrome c553